MNDPREEGQARVGARQMTEAITAVDAIKAEKEYTDLFRSFDCEPDVVTRAAQVRYGIANEALREYEREHGGPISDEESVGSIWADGLLIGLYLGARLRDG